MDSAIAVAAAMTLENRFDEIAEFDVGGLAGSGIAGVVIAAAGNCENLTDGPDAVACLLVDLLDHRP